MTTKAMDPREFIHAEGGKWHGFGLYEVTVLDDGDCRVIRDFREEGWQTFSYQGDFVVFAGCDRRHRLPTQFKSGREAIVRAAAEFVHVCPFLN